MKLTPSSEYPVLNDVYFYEKHKMDLTIARSETVAISYPRNSCSSSLVYRNFRDDNSLFRSPYVGNSGLSSLVYRNFRDKNYLIPEYWLRCPSN